MVLATLAGLTATPTGRLLVALMILFALALVGRLLLSLAWRVLFLTILVVAALYVVRVVV